MPATAASQAGPPDERPEVVDVAPDPEQTGIRVEKPPRASEMTAEELEAVRRERLKPENRPENAEIDNTGRDFDATTGRFADDDRPPLDVDPAGN